MQFQRKLMNQTRENAKKPSFGHNFGPNSGRQSPPHPKNDPAPSVNKSYGQLSSCTISEKTNDPILRKLSDGQTD